MEYLDIIKKLTNIDCLEKENSLDLKDFKKREDDLNVLQTNVDNAYKQYKEVSEMTVKKLEHSKIVVYGLGITAVMLLVAFCILASVDEIFNPAIDAKIGMISLVGFVGSAIAYLIADYFLVFRRIQKFRRSKSNFVELQNRLIADYIETLVYGYKLDLKMYKTIYKNIYDVQEYLRENDKMGFHSFKKAFEELKIDLSKYMDKAEYRAEEPHIKLIDISE